MLVYIKCPHLPTLYLVPRLATSYRVRVTPGYGPRGPSQAEGEGVWVEVRVEVWGSVAGTGAETRVPTFFSEMKIRPL